MKILYIILIFLISLPFVAANNESLPFLIENVAIDGINALEDEKVRIEIGGHLPIDVWVKGNSTEARDVKVKVWMGGYEYYDIQNITEMFDIEEGVVYKETLYLSIPYDLILGGRNYTLHIRVSDRYDEVEKDYKVYAEEKRHSIDIKGIILRPGSVVEAGKNLFVQARVENTGKVDEEDIKITVRIPKLGLSASSYLDELPSRDSETKKDSATTDYLSLRIYDDVPSGAYELVVKVEYNKGHSYAEEKKLIRVQNGAQTPTKIIDNSLISIEQNKDVEPGKQAVYKMLVTNIGEVAKSYNFYVEEIGSWGNISLGTKKATIQPKNAEEILIYVSPREEGQHNFRVQVKNEKGDMVREEEVKVNAEKAIINPSYNLKLVFIGLIAVLIVLGVLVGLKNLIVEE